MTRRVRCGHLNDNAMMNRIRRAWHVFARGAGLRFLARRKGATLVAVLTTALALGANTSVFAVVRAFLLSNFALPNADRVLLIAPLRDLPGRPNVVFFDAYPNYVRIRASQRAFSDVTASVQSPVSWDEGGDVRGLQGARVTASFFTTMGVAPALGHPFAESDEGVSPTPVVLVSDALWRGALASDPHVIGRTMRINGAPHTIIGVMPRGFAHPLPTDVWLPFSLQQRQMTAITGARTIAIWGRLKDGVSLEAAQADADAVTTRALEASADNKDFRYGLRTFREFLLPGVGRTLVFVQAGAIVLLLLAVLNLSSLLVAWGFDRRQELAVRLALGAGKAQLARMLMVQSLVVVAAGGIAGVALAAAAIPAIRQLDVAQNLGLFMEQLRLEVGVLAWSAGTALLAGLAAGLLPVWFSRRVTLGETLRSSSRAASLSPAAIRWQKTMVFTQATLSVVMLSAAALIGVSFRNITRVENGFEPGSRVVARVQLDAARYPAQPPRAQFAAQLMQNLEREPELAKVAFTTTLPVGDVPNAGRFSAELPDGTLQAEPVLVHVRRVSTSYLETIGIPLLAGRRFTQFDDAAHPTVVIVSRALAEHMWPSQNPIGKRLYRTVAGEPRPLLTEVVGVVANVLDAGYSAPAGEAVYLPYAQVGANQLSIVAIPRGTQSAAIEAVRRALRATDPTLAANGVASLAALSRQASALPRLQMLLLLTFAIVAIGIVALGSYGVMSQLVANRERELALRLVFGAAPAAIGSTVLAQVARLTVPGIIVGTGAVWLMSAIIKPFVFGIDPRSVAVAAGVGVGVLLLSTVATIPPALRAMHVDIVRGIAAP